MTVWLRKLPLNKLQSASRLSFCNKSTTDKAFPTLLRCSRISSLQFPGYSFTKHSYCTTATDKPYTDGLHKLSPYDFQDLLAKENISRCFLVKNTEQLEYSHGILKDILEESQLKELDYDHEAIFFERGQRSGCLLSVFLWKTHRGQGVRCYILLLWLTSTVFRALNENL